MRRKKRLKFKKTIFIFCEWQTEECYFQALKELKRENINIKIEPFSYGQLWTTKSKLEENKKFIYSKIQKEFDYTEAQLKGTNSKIYITLDADAYTKTEITSIKSFFSTDKYIAPLFSNHDFELFILLHLENYTWTVSNCINLIKKYYPYFEKWCCIKKREIHKSIIHAWQETLQNSIRILDELHNRKTHIKDKIPYTEIYKIYEEF